MARDVHAARTRRALALGLGGALFGHAILLSSLPAPGYRIAIADVDHFSVPDLPISRPPDLPTSVAVLTSDDLARLEAIAGPSDSAAFAGATPLPDSSADLPGVTAADRGGGAVGGAATWTGRRDEDQTALRAELWNGASEYRTPREDRDHRAATTEAIERAPDAHYGDRQPRSLAKAGDAAASKGDRAAGVGAGDGDASWKDADPVFDPAAGKTATQRKDGATRATHESAQVDRGDTATDVEHHGKTGDDVSVAAASNQRDPDPYDLTPARSGGTSGEGVRGASGDGELTDGDGHGTGASRAHTSVGHGGASVWASRTDPYLRDLLRKLDRAIVFPHDLELDLRSGRVIATMVVRADGAITSVTVTTSSGFDGFDQELTRALRAIGPLDPVPASLLAHARALRVIVPYTFRNPMIR
jgi:TonB family protein